MIKLRKLFTLLFLLPAAAFAQGAVSFQVVKPTDTLTITTPFTLELDITHPQGYKVSLSTVTPEGSAFDIRSAVLTPDASGQKHTALLTVVPYTVGMPDFRVYDTVASLNITKDKDLVQGHKKFITVLVPKNSGKFTIPAITFSFFDPATGKYKEVSTQPIAVTAAQGDASAAQFTYSAGSPAQAVTGLNDDIAYVRPSDHTHPKTLVFVQCVGSRCDSEEKGKPYCSKICCMELGFDKKHIYTTMELKMKCGLGKCGRCNIGSKYVCKDGPVFRFDQLDALPDEY